MRSAGDARKVLVIAGATATGKTAVSIALSKHVDLEVVSADARQVYRQLDIGTAKPTLAQRAEVVHHCIDIRNPLDTYSAAEFAVDARNAIDAIHPDVLPVVVGGSGLYIAAALDGFSEDIVPSDPLVRDTLAAELEVRGRMGLYEELQQVDPRAAERYADMNPRRLIRALEFYRTTGRTFSSTWDSPRRTPMYDVTYVGLARDKDELHEAIDKRCVQMWSDGLLEETANVLASDVPPTAQSLQTVGYTEAMAVLDGRLTQDQALVEMQQNTRRYAKRQITWFKRDARIQWISGALNSSVDHILEMISGKLAVVLLILCCMAVSVSAQDTTKRKDKFGREFLSAADSASALKALRSQLEGLFSSSRSRKSSVGVLVYSMQRNAVIYERDPDAMLTPASTTKLFSTAALFQRLGKQGSIATEVRTDGTIDKDGTLKGSLFLVGNGDALLSVNDLEDVADKLKALGIKRITGVIFGDGSQFDGVTDRAQYSGDGESVQPMPPVRALSLNRGTVAVVVNGAPNGRATAQCVPASDAFEVVVAGGAVPKGKRKRRSRVRVTSRVLENGTQQFVVTGSPGANRSSTTYFNMAKPALAVAGTLRSRLRAGGVIVDGALAERSTPSGTTFLVANNRPLVEFCGVVNKRSDNFLAEHVFKAVGAWCGDHSTTATRAKKALLETLDSFDIRRLDCSFNDGSGLSRRNRTSASTEVALLRSIAQQPWAAEYASTLSIAGVDGTLRGRMKKTPAENNVHGKTGTLRNVSALAGYVKTMDGEPLVFSFISNGSNVHHYKGVENQAAIALASFSYRKPLSPIDTSAALDVVDDEAEYPISGKPVPTPKTAPSSTNATAPSPKAEAPSTNSLISSSKSAAPSTKSVAPSTKSVVPAAKSVAPTKKKIVRPTKKISAKKRLTKSKAKKKASRHSKKRRR